MKVLKKLITVTACTAIIGTSLSIANVGNNNVMTVHAAGRILTTKQFNSDVHALSIASEIAGKDSGYSNDMRTHLVDGYKVGNGMQWFLNDIVNDNESNYSAVKYLYHHFYNRFDGDTKQALKGLYDQSNSQSVEKFANGLSNAISDWANKFSYVGPSKQSRIKADKKRINAAKKNLSKHHTKKNKRALNRAKNRLEVDNIKYK
ncbi:hypothetical protein DY120_00215 [Apilactobacillus micheneri]|uniref:Uncharacterized protein n=1 Tax=Apilactobacillus micheneri TaxID=1899430 RepID=A0ABY2Z390_9LACO|nr:hypothetical protein [Apilactobacillus micheneri]TPR26157.1 hypothetical protein DY114_00215 [Apilactobacillus micheneri]TPR26911.1 hypothetical protein DY111_00215 [Apilactobacillus micheneri]TPR27769.1 hypothetical protein DY113_03990 [Apilactobacillus micheneri]TPR31674.1 hypothetical protein DY117_00215 [Apilactobacillus micheneri]TPR32078.1 hypothetical protein DY120_00215 [Apilactobacillus micheneri]